MFRTFSRSNHLAGCPSAKLRALCTKPDWEPSIRPSFPPGRGRYRETPRQSHRPPAVPRSVDITGEGNFWNPPMEHPAGRFPRLTHIDGFKARPGQAPVDSTDAGEEETTVPGEVMWRS